MGLYSEADARGFSPEQAGNLRIEGLYFDRQTWISGSCLVAESSIRVGIAAQPYSFPSPTGVADLQLNTPGARSALSVEVHRGPFQGADILLQGQTPVSDRLSVGVCGGYYHNILSDEVLTDGTMTSGTTLRWRPAARTEIVPFWTYVSGGSHQVLPQVYTDGSEPAPMYTARELAARPFTSQGWHQTNFGAILRQGLGAQWRLTGGLFRSVERDPQSFSEGIYLSSPGRAAYPYLDVTPAFVASSTSGELRLVREVVRAEHARKVEFTLRGRNVDRNFGGDALINYDAFDYGVVPLQNAPALPNVPYATSPPSVDHTRQLDTGIELEERLNGVGSVRVGMLRSRYRRTVPDPQTAMPTTTRTDPWLGNARFSVSAGARLEIYASFVQGLEDSPLAPAIAINRGEPPAAMRTHQVDGGIRYAPGKRVSLIVGAFEIHKTYLNLDDSNRYTALGTIRHRGLETSLRYKADGLTLVTGGVWLRPTVHRTGAADSVPLGPVPVVLQANLDYDLPGLHPWAASLNFNWWSARVDTADGSHRLPPFGKLGLALRYDATLQKHPWSMRIEGLNLTNASGLHVTPVGQLKPEWGRRYMLTLDFDY